MELAKLIHDYVAILVWPSVVLIISIAFRKEFAGLLSRIRHAELPGGVTVDLDQQIREAKELSAKIQEEPVPEDKRGRPSIPLTEANARLIKLDLQPSPSGLDMSYYRSLAEQDPNIALAGLRMEIDVLARNLAKGFRIPIAQRDYGARLIRKLYDGRAITTNQMQLTMKVLQVCNAAAHGSPVSLQKAQDVIDSAEVLADQYVSWLSWGFNDGWTPKDKRETAE